MRPGVDGVLSSFDALRLRFSELHSDIVGERWARAVDKVDQIEKAFEDLRRAIRNEAAEITLTGGPDAPK